MAAKGRFARARGRLATLLLEQDRQADLLHTAMVRTTPALRGLRVRVEGVWEDRQSDLLHTAMVRSG